MQEMHRDTDNNSLPSDSRAARSRMRVLAGLVIILLLLVMVVVLVRKPVAEWVVRDQCRKQGASCDVTVSGLGWSNIDLEALSLENGTDWATIDDISVRYDWGWVLSPRMQALTISGVEAQLDLSGESTVLDTILQSVASRDTRGKASMAMPAIQLEEGRAHILTPAGPVDVQFRGQASSADNLDIAFAVTPTDLVLDGRALSLKAGTGRASFINGKLRGAADIDIERAQSEGADIEALTIAASLDQSADIIELSFTGKARRAAFERFGVEGADASFSGESIARLKDMGDWRSLLDGLGRLTGDVRLETATWRDMTASNVEADVSLAPESDGGGMAGVIEIDAARLSAPSGASGAASLSMTLHQFNPATLEIRATGEAAVSDAALSETLRESIAGWLALPDIIGGLEAPLRAAVNEAGQGFDVSAPIRASGDREAGYFLEADGPVRVHAATGAHLTFTPDPTSRQRVDATERLVVNLEGKIAGELGPVSVSSDRLGINLAGQAGAIDLDAARFLAVGGGDRLDASARDLSIRWSMDGAKIWASSPVDLNYSGIWRGLTFNAARLSAPFVAASTPEGWRVDISAPADLSIDGLNSRWLTLGEISRRVTFTSPLRIDAHGRVTGRGQVDKLDLPFKVGSRDYDLSADRSSFDLVGDDGAWGAIRFQADQPRLNLNPGIGPLALEAPSASATLRLAKSWSLAGTIRDASGVHDLARIEDLAWDFKLGSGSKGVEGHFRNVAFRLKDSQSPARWAATDYSGELILQAGQIAGDGVLQHPLFPEARANTRFMHDLKSGDGALAILPSEVSFSPAGLQPAMVFPVLRGIVANVSGAVSVSGAAEWGGGEFLAQGAFDLVDVGFASGKAGVFEGVFGRLVLDDIVAVRSPPDQQLVIHAWNPGVPLEGGVVTFQLDGLEEVHIEKVSFPWVGGELSSQPVDWVVSGDVNTVVVDANGLDLDALVDRVGIPDVEASGELSGVFPVEFSTGKVLVRQAELTSSNGRLAYVGDLGEKAGEQDESAGLMFDALKDFRFQLLKAGLDGDLAGEMTLSLELTGHNPDVLDGYPFNFNVAATAELIPLLSMSRIGEREMERISELLAVQRNLSPPPATPAPLDTD